MSNLPEHVRFPVIVLSLDEKEKAIEKELIIDYVKGDIYVASPTDRTNLINITEKIREQINNLQGDILPITIPGIGKILLKDIIVKIINFLDNKLEVVNIGEDNLEYLEKPGTIDKKSIKQRDDGVVEIMNFENASINAIPRRSITGDIEWVTLTQLAQDASMDNLNPANPLDGISEQVPTREATNNKIYLLMDRIQKTINPQQASLSVILPVVVDEYAKVEWMLKLGNNLPIVSFDSNVIFEYSTIYRPTNANKYYKYIFETFDNGATWLATFKEFNK